MADAWKVGDVVQLKSGGVKMTITEVVGDRVECSWFDNKHKRFIDSFPAGALMKPPPPFMGVA